MHTSNPNDEQPLFSEEEPLVPTDVADARFWKVLIVDDEPSIHDITTMVLSNFSMLGRGLEILHAYSAAEARELLAAQDDIAVILLDVVMESEHAGLSLVHHIREELNNKLVRIVLRTGQPGQAPETEVVQRYDINDYKEKTELTAKRLTTTLYTAIRSWHDLHTIDRNRRGLEQVIRSTATLFRSRNMSMFFQGLMEQLGSMQDTEGGLIYTASSGFVCGNYGDERGDHVIVAGTGPYADLSGKPVHDVLEPKILRKLDTARTERASRFYDDACVFYVENSHGESGMVYLPGCKALDEGALKLVELFCNNSSIAFDNLSLNNELEDTQREVLHMMGTVAEFRSKETSEHVDRVSAYAELLALKYGLDEAEAKLLRTAAPLHDIGKIAIPDEILKKPGKLTEAEFEVMKEHAKIGYEMLRHSRRPVLRSAAIIARDHQEKWDGSGYPAGVSGEDIHLYGRIVAVADVFDALGSERSYKEAWPIERIVDYFQAQIGQHFDPKIAALLIDNLDEFIALRESINECRGNPKCPPE